MVQSTPFFIKIATLRELEAPWQVIVSAPHSFFHWFSVAMVECVSCEKTKSALRFRHQTKMALLLRKSLKPFTFSETNLKIIDQSNLLCGSGIAEIKNNTCVGKKQGCK